MILAHSRSRHLLSLLVMLFIVARIDVERVEAQSIPLPSETPRAGTYTTPTVKARAGKQVWRPKGAVIPAQAEDPEGEPQPTAEPTLAPPLEAVPTEAQPLRGPANTAQPADTVQPADEPELLATPAPPLPPRANPLRQASRPQAYVQHTPYQRSPYHQLAQNPAAVELDVEVETETLQVPAATRVIPPQMLQEMPGPRNVPRESWQVAPGQKTGPLPQGMDRYHHGNEPGHQWPADVDNPTAVPRMMPPQPNSRRIVGAVDDRTGVPPDPRFVAPGDEEHYPDEQVPGEELYGMPRVFETNAYGRFSGRGEPLTAGSWLNRPYYIGGFIGGLGGDTLVEDEIKANGSFLWGGNLGWDYDPYWGIEMRLAFSSQGLDYYANPAYDNAYNELILWDTSLVYYPWGDARWRPYFKLGVGFADFDYTDVTGIRRSEMVYEMPFGFGMKYRVNQYWTWRFDVTDNLIFGGNAGMETQNQFSLAGGLEFRFGGRRQSYWPWNSSRRWR